MNSVWVRVSHSQGMLFRDPSPERLLRVIWLGLSWENSDCDSEEDYRVESTTGLPTIWALWVGQGWLVWGLGWAAAWCSPWLTQDEMKFPGKEDGTASFLLSEPILWLISSVLHSQGEWGEPFTVPPPRGKIPSPNQNRKNSITFHSQTSFYSFAAWLCYPENLPGTETEP